MTETAIQGFTQLVNLDVIREGQTDYIKEIRAKAKELRPHFEKQYPEWLLNRKHPGEQEWMKEYRAHTWNSPTTATTGRVINACQKIQQADDFKILWNTDSKETGIIESNSLEKYCKEDFPKYDTLENWIFTAYLKEIFADANSIFLNLPDLKPFIEKREPLDFTRPYPQLFDSNKIVYRKEKELIVKLKPLEINGFIRDRFLGVTMEGLILAVQINDYKPGENAFQIFISDFAFKDFPVTICGQNLH